MEQAGQTNQPAELADASGVINAADTAPVSPPLPRTTVVHPISVLTERGVAFNPNDTTVVVTADGELQFLFRDFRRVVFEFDPDQEVAGVALRPGIVDDPITLVADLTGRPAPARKELAADEEDPARLQDINPDAGDDSGKDAASEPEQAGGGRYSQAEIGDIGDGIDHLGALGDETLAFDLPEPPPEIAGISEPTFEAMPAIDLPVISLVALDGSSMVTATEGANGSAGEAITYLARLNEVQARDIYVHWQTVQLTATSMDFEPQDWWTVIPAGELEAEIQVLIKDDDLVEAMEDFRVQVLDVRTEMNGGDLAGIVDPSKASVRTFINNDDNVTFSIGGPVMVTEGDDAFAVFSVIQHGDLDDGVSASVDYFTSSGTATGGDDFSDILGSITFTGSKDGAVQTVSVPIVDDPRVEDDEEFLFHIDDGHGGDTVSATIIDNDSANFSISGPSFVQEGADLFAVYTVTQSGALDPGHTAAVNYFTSDLTAIDGADYTGASGVLSFAGTPHGTTQTFQIPITNDAIFESTENFRVEITPNTPNARIGIGRIDTDIVEGGPAPVVQISNGSATEGGPVEFTVNLSRPADTSITLNLEAADGTATGGADFETGNFEISFDGGITWIAAGGASGSELTFDPGQTSAIVRLDTTDDATYEGNETFTLRVDSVVTGPVSDATDTGTGTIIENETPPDVFVSDAVASEGDAAVFTVSLSGASGEAITLDLATTDASAAGGIDFETGNFRYSTDGGTTWQNAGGATGTEVTLPPNVTSILVEVNTLEDATFEGNETFGLEIAGVVGGIVGDTSDTGNALIVEDETAPDVTVSDATATEGSPAVFTVSLSGPTDENTVLDLQALGGDATAGADFETVSFRYSLDGGTSWAGGGGANGTQVTIPAGSTSVLVEVDTLTDGVFEATETFTVGVAGVVSGTVGDITDTGTGTILEASSPPDVSIADATAGEGSPLVLGVSISMPSHEDIVLDLQATGSSATAGTDFEVTGFRYSTDGGTTWLNAGGASGTEVTVPAGSTSILVEIDSLDDAVYEGDETFTVSVNGVVSGTAGDTSDTGTATIQENETPPDVTIGDASATEGSAVVMTLALSGESSEDIVLDLQATGVSAAAGTDFEVSNFRYSTDGGATWQSAGGTNGTEVTVPAGATSILVEIDSLDDAVYEGDETFTVSVNGVVSGTVGDTSDTGTATIQENDAAPTVFVTDAFASEGDAAVFTVSLSGISAETIVLDMEAVGGSATPGTDFETGNFRYSTDGVTWQNAGGAGGTEVTIPAGTASIFVEVDTTEDLVFEGDEAFTLQVAGVVAGTVADSSDTGAGVITEDESAPDILIADTAATEGSPAAFALTLSGESDENIMLDLSATGVSATDGTDFEVSGFRFSTDGGATWSNAGGASGTQVTIPAGSTQILVEIDTAADTVFEGDETFTLAVDSVVSGTVGDITDTATGTIVEDDTAPDVTISDASASEGAPAIFTVALSNAADEAITLDLLAAGVSATGGTDFEIDSFRYSTDGGATWQVAGGPNGTEVTIAPGATSLLVEVNTNDDAVFEGDETFTLAVDSVVAGPVGDTSDIGTATIVENDGAPNVVIADSFASEGDAVVFTISLTGISDTDTVLDLQTVGGSATAGADFETGNFRYSTDGGATWNFAGGASGTEVTIPAGSASIFVEVDTAEDLVFEGDETFTLAVNSVVAGSVGDTSDTGAGVIQEDEAAPDVIIGDAAAVAEGGASVFSIDLSGTSDEAITLDLAASGITASAASDFEVIGFRYSTDGGATWQNAGGPNNTRVTFAPGETSILVEVDTLDDTSYEGDETYSLQVNAVVAGTVGDISDVGTATITDAADAPDVSIGDATVAEAGAAIVSLSLSTDSHEDISLDLSATGVTATGGADFETGNFRYSTDGGATWINAGGAGGTVVTVPAGDTSILVEINTLDDTVFEGDETLTVAVNGVTAGTVGLTSDTGTVTITDAADAPNVTIGDATVAEGGAAVVTVSLSNTSVEPIVLDLSASGVTAADGVDFETGNFRYSTDGGATWINAGGAGGTEVTIPAGSSSIQVEIGTFDDAVFEGAESFNIGVASVVSGTVGATADTGAVTITDGGDVPNVFVGDASATEGSGVQFQVSLSNLSHEDVVLDVAATGGTATDNADFETANFRYSTDGGATWINAGGTNGTEVTIPAGSASILVEVDTVDDANIEADETLVLSVSGVVSGTVGNVSDTGTGTIQDNDFADAGDGSATFSESAMTTGTAPGSQVVNGAVGMNFTGASPSITDITLLSSEDGETGVPLSALTSQGRALSFTETDLGGGDRQLTAEIAAGETGAGTTAFSLRINADGSYSFTMSQPLDHPDADEAGADDPIDLVFGYTADNGTNSDTGSVTITVLDDAPALVDIVDEVAEAGLAKTDLVLVIDVSGSMGNDPGVPGYATRLDLAKAALADVLNDPSIGNVMVVDFNSTASNSGWVSAADALTYINALSDGGGTSYANAIEEVMDNFNSLGNPRPPANAATEVFFISDGKPNNNQSLGEQNLVGAWEQFLGENNVDLSLAVGVGSGVADADADLAEIGWPNDGPDGNVVILTDEAALSDTLINALPSAATGNVLADGNTGNFGADGLAHVNSLTIDGVTYVYDPASGDITNMSDMSVITGSTLSLTTNLGGGFTFEFADRPAAGVSGGDYSYIPPDVTQDETERFTFTVMDQDGDANVNNAEIIVLVERDVFARDDVDVVAMGSETTTGNVFSGIDGDATDSASFSEYLKGDFITAGQPGFIREFVADGVTYTYDVTNNQITNDSNATVVAGSVLTIGTAIGGQLTFRFANGGGELAGQYSYISPAVGDPDVNEEFQYTLENQNGVQSTADFLIDVQPPAVIISDATAVEGDALLFQIDLTGAVSGNVRLDVRPTGGTALEGDDFETGNLRYSTDGGATWSNATGPNGSVVTFPSGTTSILVEVETGDDIEEEGHESFSLRVASVEQGNVGNISDTGTGNIVDNDVGPDVIIYDADAIEGDKLAFRVHLTDPAFADLTLDLDVASVTADASRFEQTNFRYSTDGGVTWINATGPDGTYVTLPAGTQWILVEVETYDDSPDQAPEKIEMSINSVISGVAGAIDDVGVGTIIDPKVTWGDDAKYQSMGDDTLSKSGKNEIVAGLDGNDTLNGASGNEVIDGGFGNDYLTGGLSKGTESDLLRGGVGDDTLVGNSALDDDDVSPDNFFEGGFGADILDGVNSQGDDTFIFRARDLGTGVDTIRNFDTGANEDVIDLTNLLIGYDGTNMADFITVTLSGGDTHLFVDRDGAGTEWSSEQLLTIENRTLSEATLIADHLKADPVVRIYDAQAHEGDSLIFRVDLSYASSEAITLDLRTVNQTTGSGDYESTGFRYSTDGGATWQNANNGTEVTFNAGTTSLLVEVETDPSSPGGGSETMVLEVADVLAGSVADHTDYGVGTLLDMLADHNIEGSSNDSFSDDGDSTYWAGLGGNDTAAGNGGDDILAGGIGNDNLSGNSGNDILMGGQGTDTLNGGSGTDTLYGGIGADTLTGGTEADTFVFRAEDVGTGTDTITDFTAGAGGDMLDVSDILMGYDGTNLNEFVSLQTVGSDTHVLVDRDGNAAEFSTETLMVLQNVTGLDLNQLQTDGNILA